jgi:hypothetical protein
MGIAKETKIIATTIIEIASVIPLTGIALPLLIDQTLKPYPAAVASANQTATEMILIGFI